MWNNVWNRKISKSRGKSPTQTLDAKHSIGKIAFVHEHDHSVKILTEITQSFMSLKQNTILTTHDKHKTYGLGVGQYPGDKTKPHGLS